MTCLWPSPLWSRCCGDCRCSGTAQFSGSFHSSYRFAPFTSEQTLEVRMSRPRNDNEVLMVFISCQRGHTPHLSTEKSADTRGYISSLRNQRLRASEMAQHGKHLLLRLNDLSSLPSVRLEVRSKKPHFSLQTQPQRINTYTVFKLSPLAQPLPPPRSLSVTQEVLCFRLFLFNSA